MPCIGVITCLLSKEFLGEYDTTLHHQPLPTRHGVDPQKTVQFRFIFTFPKISLVFMFSSWLSYLHLALGGKHLAHLVVRIAGFHHTSDTKGHREEVHQQKNPWLIIPSKIEWDLTNGPLTKLLELLDTKV